MATSEKRSPQPLEGEGVVSIRDVEATTPGDAAPVTTGVAEPVGSGGGVVDLSVEETAGPERGSPSFRRRFMRNRLATAALVAILLIVAMAILAPWIAPGDPLRINASNRLQLPSSEHWLGTDRLGRDVMTRLMFGARASLFGAALTVGVAVLIGVPTGVLAGYRQGKIDWVLSRLAEIIMTFPTLIFALAIIAVFGPGLRNAMITLGVVFAPRLFRVVRGATMSVRAETFIEASISIGTPPLDVMRRRVLPNVMPPLLVQLSIMAATALLAEAALSLLGLGVIPPSPSWGVELGQAFLDVHRAPEGIWAPGILIAVTTLAFNIVGDGLRDALGGSSRSEE